MFDYLEKLRTKPGHVRRRIALGAAGGFTFVVAAGWLAVLVSSHPFSLTPPSFATGNQADMNSAVAQTRSSFSSLLGAVGAAQTSGGTASGITIVTEASSTVSSQPPTSIPF